MNKDDDDILRAATVLGERRSTSELRAIKAAQDFARAVNEMSFDVESFAKTIQLEHRTIQQNVFRSIGAVLRRMASDKENGYFDLRNEHAVKTAAKIVDKFGDELKYVPHV